MKGNIAFIIDINLFYPTVNRIAVSMHSKSFSLICKTLSTLGISTTLAVVALLAPKISPSAQATMEDSPKAVVDEVWQIVNNHYVDRSFNHADWQKTRQELLSKNYTDKQQAYQAIREALKQLGDPYTRFLDPDEYEELTSQTSGELTGVGLRLGIEEKTSQLTVVEPIKNSPAVLAGIKTGDRIVSINGKPTALMTLDQALAEIKGEAGTQVSLQVARQGKAFGVTLTRTQIELPSVSYSIKQEGAMRVGYIKLDEFSSHAAEQMKQAIENLNSNKVSGFVLDLRGNPGGLLFASIDIARMWMPQGAIVRTVDRQNGDEKYSANGTALTNLPLVLLVDEKSASASEILAGALKENRRARLVGTRTYGKGTVQSVQTLADGSGLAVTIARYYPPSGTNINHKGIAPDINLDLTTDQQVQLQTHPTQVGTNADPQYIKAIAVLMNQVN